MYLAERASRPGCILLTGRSLLSARLQFAEAHITAMLPNCNHGSATSLGRVFVLLSAQRKNVPFVLSLNKTVSCDLSRISRHVHMIPKSSECLCQSASQDQPASASNGAHCSTRKGTWKRRCCGRWIIGPGARGPRLTISPFERKLVQLPKKKWRWGHNH